MSGRRIKCENDGYSAFIERALRAYGRRVGQGDVEALSGIARAEIAAREALAQAVTDLRTHGYSWQDIGARLGMSRQAAQQRFGKTGEQS